MTTAECAPCAASLLVASNEYDDDGDGDASAAWRRGVWQDLRRALSQTAWLAWIAGAVVAFFLCLDGCMERGDGAMSTGMACFGASVMGWFYPIYMYACV